MTEPELKPLPCPFCGSDAVKARTFSAVCANCHAAGPDSSASGDEKVIAAWNARPRAPWKPEEIEALRYALAVLQEYVYQDRPHCEATLERMIEERS